MKEIKCNIWTKNVICVTTNGILNYKSELIMGKGIALEAKLRYPNLAMVLGRHIIKNGNVPCLVSNEDGRIIISFPTKHHWRDKSDIELIKESARRLVMIADFQHLEEVYLPHVGCSNGGLNWNYVKSNIENILDDRFIACEV